MCPKTLLGKSNQAKIYFFPIKQNVSDTIKRNGTLSGFLRHEEHWKPTTTFLLPVPSVLPSFYLRIFFCFFGQIIIFIFQLKFKSSPLFLLITKHLPMLIWSRLCCGLWGISAKSQDILTLEKENLVNLKNYDVRALSTRVVYLLLNFLNSCVSPSQEVSLLIPITQMWAQTHPYPCVSNSEPESRKLGHDQFYLICSEFGFLVWVSTLPSTKILLQTKVPCRN